MQQSSSLSDDTLARVRRELETYGCSVVRQVLPAASIARARGYLEQSVDKHLKAEVAAGKLESDCAGLPFDERMARAYASNPEKAPCSWVPQTKTSFAFQQLLFRDEALVSLVSALTAGRPAEVASRYNVRCSALIASS